MLLRKNEAEYPNLLVVDLKNKCDDKTIALLTGYWKFIHDDSIVLRSSLMSYISYMKL